eukprot:817670-Prorocentrum_lima.AAC.1
MTCNQTEQSKDPLCQTVYANQVVAPLASVELCIPFCQPNVAIACAFSIFSCCKLVFSNGGG